MGIPGFGVMAYWLIRVPAEVIKTQVQTGQAPNVREAFETAKISNPKGGLRWWVRLLFDSHMEVSCYPLSYMSTPLVHASVLFLSTTTIYPFSSGVLGLWKHYPVMLWLDIPFQIINFILYGVVSDAVAGAGFSQSILTRLFCG